MSNGFIPTPSDEILERLTKDDVNAITICGRKFVLVDCVLKIIDKADEEYELWALKFQKVRDGVLGLKGGDKG